MRTKKSSAREIRVYSEAFKAQVIREYEAGEFRSLEQAQRRYGIRGNGTLSRWLKRHGKEHLMRRVVRVESVGERDRIKELELELKRLKHVLGEERIRGILGEKYLEIACRRGGLGPVEDFKKKHDGML